jgi:hypothetical protein
MILVHVDVLSIPHDRIIPFSDWIKRVRAFPGAVELDYESTSPLSITYVHDHPYPWMYMRKIQWGQE